MNVAQQIYALLTMSAYSRGSSRQESPLFTEAVEFSLYSDT